LNFEDKTAAPQANEVLSQGFYFFAESPVKYVSHDPELNTTTASIGLGRKIYQK